MMYSDSQHDVPQKISEKLLNLKNKKNQMSIGSGADEGDHLDTFLWAEQKLPVKVI